MSMMSMSVFENEQFGQVRGMMIDDEPWFVGKDVATALGYSNTRDALAKHVDEEDKRGSRNATPSGEQNMVVINESGLYSLIFGSKLKEAKEFKHWVTSEVLPSIRKDGGYVLPEVVEKNDSSKNDLFQLINRFSTAYQNLSAQKMSDNVNRQMTDTMRYITRLTDACLGTNDVEDVQLPACSQPDFDECLILQEDASPFEQYVLTDNRQHWKVTDLAKLYGTTADRFNKKLASLGVQHKYQNAWRLEPEYENKGYDTYLNTSNVSGVSGMYWTKKGVLFLYQLLKENGILPLCEKEAA